MVFVFRVKEKDPRRDGRVGFRTDFTESVNLALNTIALSLRKVTPPHFPFGSDEISEDKFDLVLSFAR